MPCCEISDRAQMSKTIIAVRHFGLGGRKSLETAVKRRRFSNNRPQNVIPVNVNETTGPCRPIFHWGGVLTKFWASGLSQFGPPSSVAVYVIKPGIGIWGLSYLLGIGYNVCSSAEEQENS